MFAPMTADVPSELSALLAARDDASRDDAWDAFVARYSRLLILIAREYGGTHDDVMDRYAVILERLRDDDFRRLRVWTNDRRSALTTWLGVVGRRTCLDELRRRYGRARGASAESVEARRQRRRLTDLVTEALIPEMDAADAHGTVAEAELAVRRAELRERLAQSLAELPEDDQLLLALRFRDERSAADIARILRIATPFHVYRRLTRVASMLRDALRRRGVEDPVP
jgi:RNA polymerase sigma factor (sigma-70 family)